MFNNKKRISETRKSAEESDSPRETESQFEIFLRASTANVQRCLAFVLLTTLGRPFIVLSNQCQLLSPKFMGQIKIPIKINWNSLNFHAPSFLRKLTCGIRKAKNYSYFLGTKLRLMFYLKNFWDCLEWVWIMKVHFFPSSFANFNRFLMSFGFVNLSLRPGIILSPAINRYYAMTCSM